MENLVRENAWSIINWCSNATEKKNGELPIEVDHSQLRTMTSQTVDPIDWPLPLPYTEQYPLSSTYCTVEMQATNRKACRSY